MPGQREADALGRASDDGAPATQDVGGHVFISLQRDIGCYTELRKEVFPPGLHELAHANRAW